MSLTNCKFINFTKIHKTLSQQQASLTILHPNILANIKTNKKNYYENLNKSSQLFLQFQNL